MNGKSGGPGESRTPDKRFRKPLLYPSELQAPVAYSIGFSKTRGIGPAERQWDRVALNRKRALKPIVADVSAEVAGPSLSSHGDRPAVGANNGNIHQVLREEPHLKLVGSDHVRNE